MRISPTCCKNPTFSNKIGLSKFYTALFIILLVYSTFRPSDSNFLDNTFWGTYILSKCILICIHNVIPQLHCLVDVLYKENHDSNFPPTYNNSIVKVYILIYRDEAPPSIDYSSIHNFHIHTQHAQSHSHS